MLSLCLFLEREVRFLASRIQGIIVEIGGDTTKLQTALKGVNGQIKSTQSQLKDVEKLLKLDPGNTELIAQKHKLLGEAVSETKEKLTSLKTAAEQANTALANGEISQEQYDTTMLANPIVLIIAAIAALVAAFIYLWNNCNGFRQFWIDLWENVKQVAITVWNTIKEFFSQVWEAIKTIFSTVFEVIKTLVTTYFNLYKTIIETVINIIQTVITTVWEAIKGVFTTVCSV